MILPPPQKKREMRNTKVNNRDCSQSISPQFSFALTTTEHTAVLVIIFFFGCGLLICSSMRKPGWLISRVIRQEAGNVKTTLYWTPQEKRSHDGGQRNGAEGKDLEQNSSPSEAIGGSISGKIELRTYTLPHVIATSGAGLQNCLFSIFKQTLHRHLQTDKTSQKNGNLKPKSNTAQTAWTVDLPLSIILFTRTRGFLPQERNSIGRQTEGILD